MKDPVGTVWGRVESCDVFRVRLPVVGLVPLCRRGSFLGVCALACYLSRYSFSPGSCGFGSVARVAWVLSGVPVCC